MKILMVLNYGWEYGGGETYAFGLKHALTEQGHEVRLFSSNNGHDKHKLLSDYTFPEATGRIAKQFTRIYNFRSVATLGAIIRDFQPDVVHINSISGEVTPSITQALADTPTVMSIHSDSVFYADDPGSNLAVKTYGKLRAFVRRHGLRNINAFATPSNFTAGSCPPYIKPIHVVGIGITPHRYTPVKDSKSLLFVGRVAREKGLHVLLQAMQYIVAEEPEARLQIIGDGPQFAEYQTLVRTLGIVDKVSFLGRISNKELGPYYAAAAIVYMPSIVTESFGLVGIEAMSAGRPVIATSMGAIPEWLQSGRTGYLVPPNNPDALAAKSLVLLQDAQLARQMGQAAYTAAAPYDISQHAKVMTELFASVQS